MSILPFFYYCENSFFFSKLQINVIEVQTKHHPVFFCFNISIYFSSSILMIVPLFILFLLFSLVQGVLLWLWTTQKYPYFWYGDTAWVGIGILLFLFWIRKNITLGYKQDTDFFWKDTFLVVFGFILFLGYFFLSLPHAYNFFKLFL